MADEGDELKFDGVTISVLTVEGTRIKKVLVRKEPRSGLDDDGAETDD